jgi:hypothetical protein
MKGKRTEDGSWAPPDSRLLWHAQHAEPLDDRFSDEFIEALQNRR